MIASIQSETTPESKYWDLRKVAVSAAWQIVTGAKNVVVAKNQTPELMIVMRTLLEQLLTGLISVTKPPIKILTPMVLLSPVLLPV